MNLPIKDAQGNYALYEFGKIIGYSSTVLIDNIRIASKYSQFVQTLIDASKKDNIPLKLDSGLRTLDEQLALRKQNVKDKSKINDENWLMNAPSSEFNPFTGKPGFSNHQNGRAIDINVAIPKVYPWLVINGVKYGFIRTVLPETWHWEYLPGEDQFKYVPKNHPTWQGLVK